MRLIVVGYPERRLNFFKEQLAAAHRRLNWSMNHNPDWNDHAEKGEVVSFYEWAVQMAEKEPVRCGQCIHWKSADDHCTHPAGLCATGEKARNNYCSFGVRKVGEN